MTPIVKLTHRLLPSLILASCLSSLAQVRITDPLRGAYVSGPYEVVMTCDTPESVVESLLILDGEVVWRAKGFVEKAMIDFGENIAAHELYLVATTKDGDKWTSPTVVTRELEINVVATSEVILLTATVRNRRNQAMLDLKADDFEVFENGRPIPVVSFNTSQLPLDLVFLLDTSSSLRVKGLETVKKAASTFLEGLDQTDRVNLYEFKSTPIPRISFTNDRKRLLEAIEAIEPLGETALFDTLDLALNDLRDRKRGRRAVVLFTDGRDSVYETPEQKAFEMRNAITEAQNREVVLYTIGLGKRVHQAALNRMSEETGGRFHPANEASDLQAIFSEVIADLKNQYILGVKPLSTNKGFQRLSVKVKKRGAKVITRKGYTR